jgi:hypothetical protein
VLRSTVAELYTSAVPSDVRAQTAINMEFVVQAKSGDSGSPVVLQGGERLRTGDQLVFGVRVSQAEHVYVFQRKGSEGRIDVLFQNAAIDALKNPIVANQLVRIPPAGTVFTLDDQDLGREDVYLAVSRRPLPDLDAALRGAAASDAKAPALVEPAMIDLFSEGVPECAERTRGLQIESTDACGSVARGLTPAASRTDDFFGRSSSMQASTAPGDDTILRTFSFHHEG